MCTFKIGLDFIIIFLHYSTRRAKLDNENDPNRIAEISQQHFYNNNHQIKKKCVKCYAKAKTRTLLFSRMAGNGVARISEKVMHT